MGVPGLHYLPLLTVAVSLTSYLYGLLWCLRMYVEGACPDYSYYYPHMWAPGAHEIMALGMNLEDHPGSSALSRR